MEAWLVDKDFANYWTASRLLLNGQVLDLFADHATYFRHLTAQFGPDYPWRNWSYPPHYLLAIWPLALFGYATALAGFLLVTLMAFLLAVRVFVGHAMPGLAITAAILAPSMWENIQQAQNGFLTAALMLAGLGLRMERPVLAGIFFGCLTIKPQLGVLLPLLLLIERRWLVIASATLTTAALVGLSAALFGWEAWEGYLTKTLPYQSAVMTEFTGVFLGIMPTVFGALRVLQVNADIALAVHSGVAAIALLVAAPIFWRCQDPAWRGAITIMTTLVVMPYWLTYDYGIAAAALLLTFGRDRQHVEGRTPLRGLLVLSAMMPVLALPLWIAGLPFTPLLVLLGYGLVLQSAAHATVKAQ